MNRMRFTSLLLYVAIISSGCSIVIDTGGNTGGWEGGSGGEEATMAEIDAAASLTFDNAKEKSFKNIASRPALSGRVQSYLIHKAMRSLSFDNAKEAVMLTLIANPDFLAEGKKAILENLNHLSFDSAKEKVLEALSRHGHVPSENEVEIIIQQQPIEPADG